VPSFLVRQRDVRSISLPPLPSKEEYFASPIQASERKHNREAIPTVGRDRGSSASSRVRGRRVGALVHCHLISSPVQTHTSRRQSVSVSHSPLRVATHGAQRANEKISLPRAPVPCGSSVSLARTAPRTIRVISRQRPRHYSNDPSTRTYLQSFMSPWWRGVVSLVPPAGRLSESKAMVYVRMQLDRSSHVRTPSTKV
jgi:hypothetical protein